MSIFVGSSGKDFPGNFEDNPGNIVIGDIDYDSDSEEESAALPSSVEDGRGDTIPGKSAQRADATPAESASRPYTAKYDSLRPRPNYVQIPVQLGESLYASTSVSPTRYVKHPNPYVKQIKTNASTKTPERYIKYRSRNKQRFYPD